MKLWATLEEADEFHAERGNDAWAAATEPARNQALQRGSDYIRARYLRRLNGEAPVDLIHMAVYISALIELNNPGFFSVTSTPSNPNKVLVGVGDIRWQVVGGTEAGSGFYPVSSMVEDLLGMYIDDPASKLGIGAFVV